MGPAQRRSIRLCGYVLAKYRSEKTDVAAAIDDQRVRPVALEVVNALDKDVFQAHICVRSVIDRGSV